MGRIATRLFSIQEKAAPGVHESLRELGHRPQRARSIFHRIVENGMIQRVIQLRFGGLDPVGHASGSLGDSDMDDPIPFVNHGTPGATNNHALLVGEN